MSTNKLTKKSFRSPLANLTNLSVEAERLFQQFFAAEISDSKTLSESRNLSRQMRGMAQKCESIDRYADPYIQAHEPKDRDDLILEIDIRAEKAHNGLADIQMVVLKQRTYPRQHTDLAALRREIYQERIERIRQRKQRMLDRGLTP